MPAALISFSLEPSQTYALFGFAALVVWGLSERFMPIFRLWEPMAPQREKLSFYWCTPSFNTAVIFSLFDAIKLHWITIGANLSFIGYIGVRFVLAAFPVVERGATAR
jgi:hypothetical protein